MTLFQRNNFADPNDEAGVFMDGLSNAICTWVAMQLRTVNVDDAAKVFNTTPEVIREAANENPWLCIEGDDEHFELDGE